MKKYLLKNKGHPYRNVCKIHQFAEVLTPLIARPSKALVCLFICCLLATQLQYMLSFINEHLNNHMFFFYSCFSKWRAPIENHTKCVCLGLTTGIHGHKDILTKTKDMEQTENMFMVHDFSRLVYLLILDTVGFWLFMTGDKYS